ncbi:MAG TPA: hypothetical protein VMW10_02740 [Alphaproteobacteria bacterium]|nr:hypothetical protein [Alphaproteobacteria bacterium]
MICPICGSLMKPSFTETYCPNKKNHNLCEYTRYVVMTDSLNSAGCIDGEKCRIEPSHGDVLKEMSKSFLTPSELSEYERLVEQATEKIMCFRINEEKDIVIFMAKAGFDAFLNWGLLEIENCITKI